MKNKPQILQLPKIVDVRGNLSFVEQHRHIPFGIKRVYWIYDVPGGEVRGGHAFKEQDEFIISLSGSFDVLIDTGNGRKKRFALNRSYFGLFVPKGTWRSMENFSTNSLALVLASTFYSEDDYIRDYEEFLQFSKSDKGLTSITSLIKNDIQLNCCPLTSTLDNCELIDLEKNHRERGNITVIENQNVIPFDIQRIYYLYDVPGGEDRGGHSHKDLYQLIIATSGSFDVIMDDGETRKTITLNRPYQGLMFVPGIWKELVNFSSGASCLVLASDVYIEDDYIRDYNEFLKFKKPLIP
jgi:dTDP-4-dehydrorhamnose 3,5-epimerase-like enzyme